MKQIFTIAFGDYAYGAAALINSLVHFGFDGEFLVGCVGKIPWRTKPMARVKEIDISNFPLWKGNAKPWLMKAYASGPCLFIDADCIVGSNRFLDVCDDILQMGPLFCVESLVPKNDHRRTKWANRLSGILQPADYFRSDLYYNSGLFGLNSDRDQVFLSQFEQSINILRNGGNFYADSDFAMPDQDCLNGILQSSDICFQTLGPPDIWFQASPVAPFLHVGTEKSPLLYHCTGSDKIWRRKSIPIRTANPYEVLWQRFAFSEAHWINIDFKLPNLVNQWILSKPLGRILSGRIARHLRFTDGA